MAAATWPSRFASMLFPPALCSQSLISLLPVFPTMIKLSLDGERRPLQWGGTNQQASPAESSVTDISRWFVWTVFKSPSHPRSPKQAIIPPTFPCSTNHPSPLFPRCGARFGSWVLFRAKGFKRPDAPLSDVSLGSPKPTTHHFLYFLLQ